MTTGSLLIIIVPIIIFLNNRSILSDKQKAADLLSNYFSSIYLYTYICIFGLSDQSEHNLENLGISFSD